MSVKAGPDADSCGRSHDEFGSVSDFGCGGNSSYLTDGENGMIFKSEDIDELSQKLEMYQTAGAAGRNGNESKKGV